MTALSPRFMSPFRAKSQKTEAPWGVPAGGLVISPRGPSAPGASPYTSRVVGADVPVTARGHGVSMADWKARSPVGTSHPWHDTRDGQTSPKFLNPSLVSEGMKGTLDPTAAPPRSPRPLAARRPTSPRTTGDSSAMAGILKVDEAGPAEPAPPGPTAKRMVPHLERGKDPVFLHRKHVAPPVCVEAPPPRRGKGVVDTSKPTGEEYALLPTWQSRRRVTAPSSGDMNPITAPPLQPKAVPTAPSHHLALSRPLWEPEAPKAPRRKTIALPVTQESHGVAKPSGRRVVAAPPSQLSGAAPVLVPTGAPPRSITSGVVISEGARQAYLSKSAHTPLW